MFSKDFYPTPTPVIEKMLTGVDIADRIFLEPQAGKGDIVDFLQTNGAKEVIACEKSNDLRQIVAAKCNIVQADFLEVTPAEISHVDCIVMNPPFSAEENHILHAWEVAPAGCEIISLFNNESLGRGRTTKQTEVLEIISNHGYKETYGNVFEESERTTSVYIGMLRVFKPAKEGESFDDFFDLDEKYEKYTKEGIQRYDKIQDMVGRYVGAIQLFDETIAVADKMETLIAPIGTFANIKFGALKSGNHGLVEHVNKSTFRKTLQKSAWQIVFREFNIGKFVTSSINEELNKFIEKQENFPFTKNNIFKMIDMIIGTTKDRMDRVLVEAFEHICSKSAKNSTAGKKWKTNSDYKLNLRFIIPNVCDWDRRWPSDRLSVNCSAYYKLDDINKALCYLTGDNYGKIQSLSNFVRYSVTPETAELPRYNQKNIEREWGTWYEWHFFKIRGYKAGTMHFEFKDPKVLDLFNLRVAEIKGWALPKQTDRKRKGNERTRTSGVEVFQPQRNPAPKQEQAPIKEQILIESFTI